MLLMRMTFFQLCIIYIFCTYQLLLHFLGFVAMPCNRCLVLELTNGWYLLFPSKTVAHTPLFAPVWGCNPFYTFVCIPVCIFIFVSGCILLISFLPISSSFIPTMLIKMILNHLGFCILVVSQKITETQDNRDPKLAWSARSMYRYALYRFCAVLIFSCFVAVNVSFSVILSRTIGPPRFTRTISRRFRSCCIIKEAFIFFVNTWYWCYLFILSLGLGCS